jgi:hypothetical protein
VMCREVRDSGSKRGERCRAGVLVLNGGSS